MTQCHKRARILPVWGEFLKRGEKGEEKKELDRGLHIFTSIACSVSSRVKARFFAMVNEESAEINTTATRNGKFSEGDDILAPKWSIDCLHLYSISTFSQSYFHTMSIYMYLAYCWL